MRLTNVNAGMVRESVGGFKPYRNEYANLVDAIAIFDKSPESFEVLRRFLERILPYRDRPEGVNSWNTHDFENFRIIIHEIYLYTIAILLRRERYDAVASLSDSFYDLSAMARGMEPMVGFSSFFATSDHLDHENSSKNPRRVSPLADLMKEREDKEILPFIYVMQADLVLWLKAQMAGDWWYPVTLIYSANIYGPFEIFARAHSKSYFDKLKTIFLVNNAEEFKEQINRIVNSRNLPRFNYDTLQLNKLANVDKLSIKP